VTSIGALPSGLACYRKSPLFTRDNVPAALLSSHNVKAGVWGVLRVTRGRVRYHLDGDVPASEVIAAGEMAVIEPEAAHHVEMLDADSAFLIEFHRAIRAE
jgi:tellurite resistance-related uncharacterized protein